MKVSIIIPVFNESATIRELIEKVRNVELPGLDREIIIVNDGSTDTTRILLEKEKNEPFTVVHNSLINIGKGAAVRIGFEHASGEIILVQDADLELEPGDYPGLLQPILDGKADVVYGSRFLSGKNPCGKWTSYMANRLLTMFTNVLYGSRLTDMETCYKVMRKNVLEKITLRSLKFDLEPEITAKILKSGYSIHEVPIRYKPRTVKEGKKINWKDGFVALYILWKYRK